MTEAVLVLFLLSFVIDLIMIFLVVTLFRGLLHLMDDIDRLDNHIKSLEERKVNKPIPPPNIVPLEKI